MLFERGLAAEWSSTDDRKHVTSTPFFFFLLNFIVNLCSWSSTKASGGHMIAVHDFCVEWSSSDCSLHYILSRSVVTIS